VADTTAAYVAVPRDLLDHVIRSLDGNVMERTGTDEFIDTCDEDCADSLGHVGLWVTRLAPHPLAEALRALTDKPECLSCGRDVLPDRGAVCPYCSTATKPDPEASSGTETSGHLVDRALSGAAQEYAGCPEWLGEGERCSSCHDDHNDDRAEEVRCRVCNGPLSEARLALGLTLCSGACHRAIRTAQKPDPPSDDAGSALVSLLLAVSIVGGLLGLLLLGQRAMCVIHDDQILYCDGYSTVTTQETP
jgi:DNA-directed RNA polymerase subunit RPC12/RpoP